MLKKLSKNPERKILIKRKYKFLKLGKGKILTKKTLKKQTNGRN